LVREPIDSRRQVVNPQPDVVERWHMYLTKFVSTVRVVAYKNKSPTEIAIFCQKCEEKEREIIISSSL
jgi:hypothetical protein